MSEVIYLAQRVPARCSDLLGRFALCSCDGRSECGRLLAGRDILLTTYRPDGTPKPVLVWAYPHEDHLVVWTDPKSCTVRRIMVNPQIALASCTCRGHTVGLQVHAVARILPDDESRSLAHARALDRVAPLAPGPRGGKDCSVALECTRVA